MRTNRSILEVKRSVQKLNNTRLLWSAAALIVGVIALGYFVFRTPDTDVTASSAWLLWLLILLCPLMHLFMHRGYGRRDT